MLGQASFEIYVEMRWDVYEMNDQPPVPPRRQLSRLHLDLMFLFVSSWPALMDLAEGSTAGRDGGEHFERGRRVAGINAIPASGHVQDSIHSRSQSRVHDRA